MFRDGHQHSPASTARTYRAWLGYIYGLATVLAVTFLSFLAAGIIMQLGSLIFGVLFMSVSFALFSREVGSHICRDSRRRGDRALTLHAKTQ